MHPCREAGHVCTRAVHTCTETYQLCKDNAGRNRLIRLGNSPLAEGLQKDISLVYKDIARLHRDIARLHSEIYEMLWLMRRPHEGDSRVHEDSSSCGEAPMQSAQKLLSFALGHSPRACRDLRLAGDHAQSAKGHVQSCVPRERRSTTT